MYYRDENGDWQEIILEPSGDTLPIGAITQFGGETAPTNWLFCNGQAVSRTDYAELFSAIGTTYGDGDGSTTFNVPDFSSRSPMGVGTGTDGTNSETTTLGQEKGEYKHTLTANEIPPLTTYAPSQVTGGNMAYLSSWTGYTGSGLGNTPITKTKTSNAEAHNIVHPVLGVNFIIKAKQSIGIVGTVSEDITDTNNNAVPTCETVKKHIQEDITTDGEPVKCGYKVDGKDVYVQRYSQAFDTTSATINHNLDLNNITIVNYSGYMSNNSSCFPLPSVRFNYTEYQTEFYITGSQVVITTNGGDRTGYTAYIEIYFTYND